MKKTVLKIIQRTYEFKCPYCKETYCLMLGGSIFPQSVLCQSCRRRSIVEPEVEETFIGEEVY